MFGGEHVRAVYRGVVHGGHHQVGMLGVLIRSVDQPIVLDHVSPVETGSLPEVDVLDLVTDGTADPVEGQGVLLQGLKGVGNAGGHCLAVTDRGMAGGAFIFDQGL